MQPNWLLKEIFILSILLRYNSNRSMEVIDDANDRDGDQDHTGDDIDHCNQGEILIILLIMMMIIAILIMMIMMIMMIKLMMIMMMMMLTIMIIVIKVIY